MGDAFDDIRVKDLAFFDRLAALGSFTAVAKELHLPRATASRWLSTLEARVGEPLVKRTTRSVALTEAGQRFATRARELLQVARAAQLDVRAGAPGGLLRVAVPVPMGRMLAGPIIAAFRRRMPGVQLEVKLQAEQVDLVRDRFDLVLRGGALPDSALKARRLATAKMWLYCSARHQEEPLTALPFIAAPGDEVLLKRAGHHVADRPAVLVDDRTAIADALTWGAGFGLLPSFLGEGPREQGALVRRSDAPIAALPVHALYHPAQREDPRLLALVEEFRRHLERVL